MEDKLAAVRAGLQVTGDEGPNSDQLFRYLVSLAESLYQHTVELQETVSAAILPAAACSQ